MQKNLHSSAACQYICAAKWLHLFSKDCKAEECIVRQNLKFEKLLKHPIHDVWAAISEEEAIAEWFMPGRFRAEEGYAFELESEPARDWDGRINGKILKVNPPHLLSYTFLTNELDHETIVTITLQEQSEGTLLILEHSNMDKLRRNADYLVEDMKRGWTHVLANFVRFMDGDSIEE